MKTTQHFVLFFSIFWLLLQPVSGFAGPQDAKLYISESQEGFSYFKTKNSKSLVLGESSVPVVKPVFSSGIGFAGLTDSKVVVPYISNPKTSGLVVFDHKNRLKTQVFPFHFFF